MRFVAFVLVALALQCGSHAESPAPPATELLASVEALKSSLDEAQSAKLMLPFDAEARIGWSFLPGERQGLAVGEMKPEQEALAAKILQTCLSESGYAKVTSIRDLEDVLREMENSPTRDRTKYYFAIFGAPGGKDAWAVRYEGHHLSLNWTIVDGQVIASTPQFLGSNPGEVRQGPKQGQRTLGVEEDLARTLLESLTEEQRKAAILSDTAPADIITRMDREAAIQEDKGVAFVDMTDAQKAMLVTLIEEYAHVQRPDLSEVRLKKVHDAGLDTVKFAWMGGVEKGQGHYYRVQGPTFLIEYDNTQNNANHVHCVWRDFEGDFGRDLLKDHYDQHGKKHEH